MRQVDTIEIVDVVQAKEDGIKIGKEDGIKIGEANGIAKERKKVIMSLYSHNVEPLEIAKLLNLSKEEVDKIINSEVSK